MHSPMSFFDTTPLGRIVNRLSKDINIIDQMLPFELRFVLIGVIDVIGMIVAISYATPLYLAAIPPLALLYFFIQVR